jgi:hypothetical protein
MDGESVRGVVNARELREVLSSYEFFYDLSETALEALAGAAERVFVRAGQRILEDGVPAYAAFIVEYGRIRTVTRRSHQTITLEEGRGELIGMISLLSQEPFDGEAFTLRDSKQYLQQLVATGHVDLFLTPPVQEFQLLGFDAYEKLYQIDYEYTRKQLAEWGCLQEVATGGRCTS